MILEHMAVVNGPSISHAGPRVDLGRLVAYGSSRTAEAEVAGMALPSWIEQLVESVPSFSNEDLDRLHRAVQRERRKRGLVPMKGRDADQGGKDDKG